MKIKNYFFLIVVFISLDCNSGHNTEKFYSSVFLRDYLNVRKDLEEIGFRKITFKTSDNFELSGLFLSRPYALCNVIVCAGWLPGRKEGMATFYALLPEYCNILFFDARGHGESEGSLLWKLWRYGIDEYKDIIGAISWIQSNNELPVIVAGICSGAFNAAHAIAYLENNKSTLSHHVRGLIFDSGWGSVTKIITTAPIAGIKKRLALILRLYFTKKQVQNSYLYKISSCLANHFCDVSNYLCAQPLAEQYDRITNLSYTMKSITLPVLFIHSYDDIYANIDDAIALSHLAQHKHCWWIEKSSHAKHHLIHKDLYKEKLTAFIDTVLQ